MTGSLKKPRDVNREVVVYCTLRTGKKPKLFTKLYTTDSTADNWAPERKRVLLRELNSEGTTEKRFCGGVQTKTKGWWLYIGSASNNVEKGPSQLITKIIYI